MRLSTAVLRDRLRDRSRVVIPRTESTRESAVAIVLQPDSGEVLLMKRARVDGDPWSGHMSFPGGRRESSDSSLVATAIRETHEEVGIDLAAKAELVGCLDEVRAIGRGLPLDLIIAPVVFSLTETVTLRVSEEAEEVLWASIEPMLRGERETTLPYNYQGKVIHMPGFRVAEHTVWGLTHRMLTSLFDLLHA